MADQTETQPAGAEGAEQNKMSSRLLAQYIRDMSFENILVSKGVQGNIEPQVQVKVSVDARKRGSENQFEVITKLIVDATNKSDEQKLFLLELEYGALFHIEGLPEEQLHPYLLIECPRLTFPFVRRIVSDVTRDGGFPAVNLDMIDFVSLYRQELTRRAAAQKEAEAPKAN